MACREISRRGPNHKSQRLRYGSDSLLNLIAMPHKLLSKTSPQVGTGKRDRPAGTLIHILDEHSLLNIFSLYRPLILDETIDGGKWDRERWWYTLVHVCRRWRYLVLQSPSYLRLSLLCTRGTPVADMLANSPSLPLTIDHLDEYKGISTEDEKGIILALQHHDRVRRIRLRNFIPNLQKLILALDGEFPILEYLLIHYKYPISAEMHDTILNIPESFRAPNLRHLLLMGFPGFNIQIESPLLTTMTNLVTLNLDSIPASSYFHPNDLFRRISLMPQLEIIRILFSPNSNSGDAVERQLLRAPITGMTHVTFPNLRWFGFTGVSAYLEALLPWVNFPLLEKLEIYFFNQPTYSIPHLQRYISAAWNFRPNTITLNFYVHRFDMTAQSLKAFLSMGCWDYFLDRQVASAAQVFHTLRTAFSTAEHITLQYKRHSIASRFNIDANRTQWRELLGHFSKVKTIVVDDELVGQLAHSLQPGEAESPMELLPELQELSYYGAYVSRDVFAQFIDARQKAGHPVTVIRY